MAGGHCPQGTHPGNPPASPDTCPFAPDQRPRNPSNPEGPCSGYAGGRWPVPPSPVLASGPPPPALATELTRSLACSWRTCRYLRVATGESVGPPKSAAGPQERRPCTWPRPRNPWGEGRKARRRWGLQGVKDWCHRGIPGPAAPFFRGPQRKWTAGTQRASQTAYAVAVRCTWPCRASEGQNSRPALLRSAGASE